MSRNVDLDAQSIEPTERNSPLELKSTQKRSNAEAHVADNILLGVCGPPRSPIQLTQALSHFPVRPKIDGLLPYERLDMVSSVRDLHMPRSAGIAVARQIDLMLREGYRKRLPTHPTSWQSIYALSSPNDESHKAHVPRLAATPLAGAVIGVSGAGKSAAIERALSLYPQIVQHDRFPHLAGKHKQLVWLKVDAPPGGKSIDLARNLSVATDEVLGTDHFTQEALIRNARGSVLLNLWLRRVAAHFPGIVVIDEIQNLFKIETLRQRKNGYKDTQRPQLRIVDDEALKFILTLINTAKFPVLVSGTPDAMAIFETRMSTSQRLTIDGLIQFPYAATPEDGYFKDIFVPALLQYQWLDQKMPYSPTLLQTMHKFTAGLPRICVNLWVQAQRLALEKNATVLDLKHFEQVMAVAMKPDRVAVEALLSGDPRRMLKFEDIRPDFD